jgi:flagellar protein FlgJ
MSTPIQEAAAAAKDCEAKTGVPATLTMAQWALESAWGKSQPGNNCFGIKAYEGCYGTQDLTTHETIRSKSEVVKQEFACFECLADCFNKHAELISTGAPYAAAWASFQKTKDADGLAKAIAPMYATDPLYANKLRILMHSSGVTLALAGA